VHEQLKLNIPNIITLARIVAVPVTIWLMLEQMPFAAFWLFAAAGISDALDGFIAKTFNCETEVGAYLDPIADKMLLVGVFVTLGYMGHVPLWLVMLIVFRDLVIVGGALLFETVTRSLEMAPLLISKINTVAQILLAGLVLGAQGYGLELDGFHQALIWSVAATTVLSGVQYVYTWGRKASTIEQQGEDS